MRAKRAVLGSAVAAIALAVSMFTAAPAIAARPAAGCPPAFNGPATFADVPTTDQAGLASVDKNGDGLVCWKYLPQTKKDQTQPVNAVDNTSNH